MEAIHDIVSAKALDGYKVDVEYDTGEKAVFDCSRYLDMPYWKRLNDKALFNQVMVGYGTLVWPGEIDIGPEDVWEFAERYA
jgi:hypothetical protein